MIQVHPTVFLALVALSILLSIKLYQHIINEKAHKRRARELGCGQPFQPPYRWALGIPHIVGALRASRNYVFPDYLIERSKFATTAEISFLGQTRYFTCDPANIKAVLATQFKDFGLGSDRINNFAPLLGHGIFSSDGKKWEASRAMLRPQFARDQVSDLDLEEHHVQNLLQALDISADGWTTTVDLQVLFFRLTLDSATEFLFGESLNSQVKHLDRKLRQYPTATDTDEKLFAYSFDKALGHLADGTKLARFFWLAHTPSFKKAKNQVHRFVDHYVRIGLSRTPEEHAAEYERTKRYVFLNTLASTTRDPIEIRSELLSILLAGRDTTASLLGWIFQLFAQHPEVYQKLREVVLTEFGTFESPRDITFATLKSCAYLQNVINESLRLFPVVPINFRRCLVPFTTLPTGGGPTGLDPVYVREGEEIIYSVHAMHRLEKYWGSDAETFNPERWTGRKPGWEYLAFNGGPRICIGQQFALTETGYVVVRMVQRFEKLLGVGTPVRGQERHNLTLTNCPANGVHMRLKVASKK